MKLRTGDRNRPWVPIAAGTVGVGVVGKITYDKKKKKGLFAKK